MKKVLFVLAAAACMVACGNKAAQDETAATDSLAVDSAVVDSAVVEAPAAEATEAAATTDVNKEKETLIDQYVKACEAENEIEATRVAKKINSEYKEYLTSADVERMTNASAVLANKRAEQAKEGAAQAKEAASQASDALKSLKK